MKMYAIKSLSEEGTYFITRNWKQNNAWFTRYCSDANAFKTEKLALAKLDRLISVSSDYNGDAFTMIAIDTDTRTLTELYDIDIWSVHARKERRTDRYVNFG